MNRLHTTLKVWKPDVVVHGGDLNEAEAASRFIKEDPGFLDDEYKASATLLSEVRALNPKSRYVLLDGNHDDNLKQPGRLPKALRAMVQPSRHRELGAELDHWENVPYVNGERGAFWLGSVCFKHGYSTTNEDLEALWFAGDIPSPLIVGGHTHRPVPVTRCMRTRHVPLHVWYANAGTLGPLSPAWASRENTRNWGAACVVGLCSGEDRRSGTGVKWRAEVVSLEDPWEVPDVGRRPVRGGRSDRRGARSK